MECRILATVACTRVCAELHKHHQNWYKDRQNVIIIRAESETLVRVRSANPDFLSKFYTMMVYDRQEFAKKLLGLFPIYQMMSMVWHI